MSDFYCSECQIVWAGDHCRNCSPPLEADDQRITSWHDNPDAVVHVEDPVVRLLTVQLQDANKQIAKLERRGFYCQECQIVWDEDCCKICSDERYRRIVGIPACNTRLIAEEMPKQIESANQRIHELEQENKKLRDDMRSLMHSAAHPPSIADEPAEFPANALRFSA